MPVRGRVKNNVGEVRETKDGFQWRRSPTHPWQSAVRHCDVRGKMLDSAPSNGQHAYVHGRKAGPYQNDETSWLATQQFWGADRATNWPEILYQLEADENFKNSKRPDSILEWKGEIVLDQNLEPIADFPDLPLTISSEAESEFIEAWTRTNKTLTLRDIRSRMPPEAFGENERAEFSFNNKMSMRGQRFRKNSFMITWAPKAGSKAISRKIMEWLDRHYPEARRNNSIRGVPPPTKEMVACLKKVNAGSRSRKRRVEDSEDDSDCPLIVGRQTKRQRRARPESEESMDDDKDTVEEDSSTRHSLNDIEKEDEPISTDPSAHAQLDTAKDPSETSREPEEGDRLLAVDILPLAAALFSGESDTQMIRLVGDGRRPATINPCDAQHGIPTLALYLDQEIQPFWRPQREL